MLKRLVLLLLEFGAALAGNVVAGWIQQDAGQGLFTPLRLLGTVTGAAGMLVVILLLESERNLSWNWRWHRYWYLRALAQNGQLRRWEKKFVRLTMARGRHTVPDAEVIAGGERQDVIEVLREIILEGKHGNRHALVLGEPGSGKTTALERLTWDVARRGVRRQGWGGPIPVLLRLGNYQDGNLMTFAAEEMLQAAAGHSGKVLSRGLADLLENGRVALLFDALDEALGERRDLVLAEIDRLLCSRHYDQTPVVISARTREDPGNRLDGLLLYTIQDLSDEKIAVFIRVYRREVVQVADVLARLQRAGVLQPGGLGRNPFWLQLMVGSGVFEEKKGRLLIQSVGEMLQREWKKKPATTGWARPLARETQHYETRQALMWLAYQMSVNSVVSLPYDQVLHELLPDWLQTRKGAGDLRPIDITGLGRDAQLLICWPGLIRFRHQLIQEALTAQLLAEDESLQNDVVAQCGEESSWWEILIMLGHLVENPGALAYKLLKGGQSAQRLILAVGILQNSDKPMPAARAFLVGLIGRSLKQGVSADHRAAVAALAQFIPEDILDLLLTLLRAEKVERQRPVLELLVAQYPLEKVLLDVDGAHQWAIIQLLATWEKGKAQNLLADMPSGRRIRCECALEQLGDPQPGAGIIVLDGQWLPDIGWGKVVLPTEYVVGGDPEAYGSFEERMIQIQQPYHLARFPVTYAQFQCFVDAEDFAGRDWWEGIPVEEQQIDIQRFNYWNHPREMVSWYQAVAFCRWLSMKLAEEIDLPHEYEWEAAARYPDNRLYPWGDQFDPTLANFSENGNRQTNPVGSFPEGANKGLGLYDNWFALYDLSGNVLEWCRNRYRDPESSKTMEIGSDPRTLRGGSWYHGRSFVRAASRSNHFPFIRNHAIGFRVVHRLPAHHDQ